MNKNVWIWVAGIAVLALGGWLFVNNAPAPQILQENPSTGTEAASSAPEASARPAENERPAAAMKEFTVTGKNYSFDPSTISVQKGDRIKIIFRSAENFHDFRLDEFGAATKRISAGQEDTAEFTADKAGAFEYYCSVGNHRAMGMKGTLTVEE